MPLNKEIERKFLLTEFPAFARGTICKTIVQGWIPGTQIQERLRVVGGSKCANKYLRTIKLGSGIERIEIEEEISPPLFYALWPLTAHCRVYKDRYTLVTDEEPDQRWEIDKFKDRSLVLAEIEMKSVDAHVEFPWWLQPFILREVTEDPAFSNRLLGLPETRFTNGL